MFHFFCLVYRLFPVGLIVFCLYACGSDTSSDTTKTAATSQDDSVRLVLEEIFDTDQGIREEFTNLGPAPLVDGMIVLDSTASALNNQMIKIDSINMERLLAILKGYGYPKISRVGEKASNAAFYVIQHGDTTLMGKYVDTLGALAAKGEVEPKRAAMMRDRVLMNRNQKQIYGSQASPFANPSIPDSYFIWPIADPDSVNAKRKQVGFETTVEEVAIELDAVYDPELALPSEPVE